MHIPPSFSAFHIPVIWKLPPGKLLLGWFPPDNSQSENFEKRKFPPRKTPTRKIATSKNYHPHRRFPPGKIFIQPIAIPDNCCPANLIKWVQKLLILINPFVPNAPFVYPLKTSERHKAFHVLQVLDVYLGISRNVFYIAFTSLES